jgi:hypothetical protein
MSQYCLLCEGIIFLEGSAEVVPFIIDVIVADGGS